MPVVSPPDTRTRATGEAWADLDRLHPGFFGLPSREQEDLARTLTDPDALRAMRDTSWFKSSLAENPSLPPDLMLDLVMSCPDEVHVMALLAANPAITPEAASVMLATDYADASWQSEATRRIRRALLGNACAPMDVLLAGYDPADPFDCHALAANPSLPESALRVFAGHGDGRIRAQAGRNPSISEDLLLRMVRRERASYVRVELAASPAATRAVVEALAERVSEEHEIGEAGDGLLAAVLRSRKLSAETAMDLIDRYYLSWDDHGAMKGEAFTDALIADIASGRLPTVTAVHVAGIREAKSRGPAVLGIDPANSEAIEYIQSINGWWRLAPDSSELMLATTMFPNA